MDDLTKTLWAPARRDELIDLGPEALIGLPIAGFGIDIVEGLRVLSNMLDEFRLGMDAQLPEDPLKMVADGGWADRKLLCDRGYAPAVSQLVEDFLLAFAERV